MGATTLLNVKGDTTIVWDPENDDRMEEVIRKKMSEGITFFVVEPRLGGMAAPIKTKLEDASRARQHRALAIPDEDFASMVGMGAASLTETPAAPIKKARVSRDAREVATSESVGVKQKKGG